MDHFHALDFGIIGLYLVFALSMGPLFYRLAKKSTTDFFLSGRELPWWLSGTSMVATTFGAGTPLLITGFIWGNGVFMNWWWWSFALSNVMTVVFFARLWRRAKVTTDVEFSELRYGGAAGAWLRGFRSIYFGGLVNTFIMAWLMFGAFGIAATLIGADPGNKGNVEVWLIIVAIVGLVVLYSSMAGLWGVVTTDMVQFAIAMVSCIVLAVLVVGDVGGMAALKEQVIRVHPLKEGVLNFFPTPALKDIPWIMLASFFLVQWWCSYYPGSEPGGGAYVAQRMLASKSEKHAQLATLWFSVAHYAVRPWPWILVALATVVLYPELTHSTAANAGQLQELTYIRTIVDYMPMGWKGAMVAFLCAAFMSTVDTHLNWGASYLVRDLYARFLRPGRRQAHYVVMSRVVMILTAVASALVAIFMINSIGDANRYFVGLMSGIGLVFVLRFCLENSPDFPPDGCTPVHDNYPENSREALTRSGVAGPPSPASGRGYTPFSCWREKGVRGMRAPAPFHPDRYQQGMTTAWSTGDRIQCGQCFRERAYDSAEEVGYRLERSALRDGPMSGRRRPENGVRDLPERHA